MTAMKSNADEFGFAGVPDDSGAVSCGLISAERLSWWKNPSINEASGREQQLLLNFILFHDSRLLLLYMDADGKILFSNKAVESLTGYGSSDLQGKYMWDIFMPFESAEYLEALRDRPGRGLFPFEYENFILTRSGARKYTIWRGGRFLGEGGAGERMALAGFDMTERIKQESRLYKKMEQKADTNQNAIGNAKKKRAIDESVLKSTLSSLSGSLESGITDTYRINPDEEIPFERPEMVALKEQVRMINSVFERANAGIIITDAGGAIRCVNPALCSATGYTVGDFIGKSPSILKSGRHDASFYAKMWDEIGKTGQWQGKVWNRRKSGEIYPTWLSISSIKDGAGQAVQYIGISVDMSRGAEFAQSDEAISATVA